MSVTFSVTLRQAPRADRTLIQRGSPCRNQRLFGCVNKFRDVARQLKFRRDFVKKDFSALTRGNVERRESRKDYN